jgi:hypothetical protein
MTPIGPTIAPPHGLALPVKLKRVIDGDTIEVLLPSGRAAHIRIEGYDAAEMNQLEGRAAKHDLETLLEVNAGLGLTAFIPLPEDKDKNGTLDMDELFRALSFERIRAWLFAGRIRVDAWMMGGRKF